jgi:hypothetical protein
LLPGIFIPKADHRHWQTVNAELETHDIAIKRPNRAD